MKFRFRSKRCLADILNKNVKTPRTALPMVKIKTIRTCGSVKTKCSFEVFLFRSVRTDLTAFTTVIQTRLISLIQLQFESSQSSCENSACNLITNILNVFNYCFSVPGMKITAICISCKLRISRHRIQILKWSILQFFNNETLFNRFFGQMILTLLNLFVI